MNVNPKIVQPDGDDPIAPSGTVQLRFRTAEDRVQDRTSRRPSSKSTPTSFEPEKRAKLRDLWSKAKSSAESLWRSSQGDKSEMFGAAVKLSDCLERLWDLRADRDDNWVGILDQTRTALEQLARVDIDAATEGQCWKLLQIVESHLSPAAKAIRDLQEVVQLVADMGLNPYSGLEPLGGS